MESRFSRYVIIVTLIAALGFIVSHYKGQWISIPLLSDFFTVAEDTPELLTSKSDISTPPEIIKTRSTEHHEFEMSSEQRRACGSLTVTQGLEVKKQDNGIYTWVDDKGITHFSDVAAANKNSILSQYSEPQYSFDIEINSIATNPPPFLRNKLTTTLKHIDAEYRQLLPKRELLPIKIDLILAGSAGAYSDLQRKYSNSVSASQGFYSSKHNVAAVLHHNDQQAFRTAVHESVHVMNAGQFGSTPRWFNEGLAEYFESPLYLKQLNNKSQFQLATSRQVKAASKNYRSGKYLSLVKLFNANDADWNGSSRSLLYQNSRQFIQFLMSSSKGRQTLNTLFTQFSEQRCIKKTPIPAQKAYPGDMRKLEQDWLKWRKS
ncbi:hypothetical protein Q4601_20855 [Shewanella sp. 1_MG-2023]|uniref:hypothetical protein n=1 Tax=unclassified Shewanella TaxID=196818 RepID=UPI0026E2F890|nr:MULTISPECIES: hypothetical protein [unclassified Shewanella]MDO6613718.1 hypothetical protein [Shewanella sp. 7_MG-2023]MDO6773687.1 hypothetical protein [Shewanella sp. 2_MG-2023]MDO6796746.1 hypothetical protein [Shewanella sp. 1_MG-2023]